MVTFMAMVLTVTRYWRFGGYHRGSEGVGHLSFNYATSILACSTPASCSIRSTALRASRLWQDNVGEGGRT